MNNNYGNSISKEMYRLYMIRKLMIKSIQKWNDMKNKYKE